MKKTLTTLTTLTLAGIFMLPTAAHSSTITVTAKTACTSISELAQNAKGETLVCKENKKGKLVWARAKTISAASLSASSVLPRAAATSTGSSTSLAGSAEVTYPDPSEAENRTGSLPAPTGMEVVSVNPRSASIAFTPKPQVRLYTVYIRHGDSFVSRGIRSSNPSAVFDNLVPGLTYTACVYYNASAESDRSCSTFTTPSDSSAPAPIPQASAPAGFSARATSDTIAANWPAVAGATRYNVCHVTAPEGSWTCRGVVDTSFTFTGLTPSRLYGVTVEAIFADGSISRRTTSAVTTSSEPASTSAPSAQPAPAPAPVAPTPTPSGVQLGNITNNGAAISWDSAATPNVDRWIINIRHGTSHTSTAVAGSDTSFSTSDLAPGTGYEVTVRAITSDGNLGEPIKIEFVTPQP